jgi:hypothetical protein
VDLQAHRAGRQTDLDGYIADVLVVAGR